MGRYKLNRKLDLAIPQTIRTLTQDDVIAILRRMVQLDEGRGKKDDIDHLGNRRVRSVGELIQQQFRVGLLRMERVIKERMAIVQDPYAGLAQPADQHPSGRRGDEGVLRRQPALAVHGPDESAGGDRPQAASLGAWPGRPLARARRIRRA